MLFVLRFLIGGTVVALLPIVAARLGTAAAGLLMVIPAITLVGLSFVWADSGRETAMQTALGGLPGLIAVASFLGVFAFAARLGLPVSAVFLLAFAAWLLTAALILAVRHFAA